MSSCANCNSTDLVTVELTVADGRLRFSHCRACEHRWWADVHASTVSLGDVLTRAAA